MKKNSRKIYAVIITMLVIGIIVSSIALFFGIKNVINRNVKKTLIDKEDLEYIEEVSSSDDKKELSKLDDKQKEFIGVKDDKSNSFTYNEEDNYTDEYKNYLKLNDAQKEKNEVIPRKEKVPIEKLEEIKENIEINDNLPSKFNLADKINIHISDQENFGLCWDFASIKSLETYALINEGVDYNLSEIHVDYLMSNEMYGYRKVHDGGTFSMFINYLKLTGAVPEEKLEYRDYSEDEYKDFLNIEPVLNVSKTVLYPKSPALEEKHNEDEVIEFRNIIKNHIMKKGSLYAVIATPDFDREYFDSTTYSEYFNGNIDLINPDRPRHAVSVVGWDDNYSKDNFATQRGEKPKNDGAYIVLNSWGKEWGDNGYFYVSYEDKYIESELSGVLSTSTEDYIKISSLKGENFKKYIDEKYKHLYIDIDGEKYLKKIVLDNIYYLDLSNRNLNDEDLENIKLFSDLTALSISNNNITDLSSLVTNDNINMLNASKNNISDISVLGQMSKLEHLNLEENNISDISIINKLNKLLVLNISNNPINWNEKLTNNHIANLEISKTGLDNISYIKDLNNINSLNISNNNLTELNDIDSFSIMDLDISNNKIKNWDFLYKLKKYKDEYDIDYGLWLKANNCGINDISIFNNTQISNLDLDNNNIAKIDEFNNEKVEQLSLVNNKISDISKFNKLNIYYINLSENKKLKGLDSIKEISSVILSNNQFTNLNEIKKLTGVNTLDISYNDIDDYSDLKEMNNLYSLSLEGNKNIELDNLPKNLYVLNLKKCNIDNSQDFSKYKSKLQIINLSNNKKFSNYDSINFDSDMGIYIIATDNNITYKDYEKLINIKTRYIDDIDINLEYDISNNKTIYLEFGSVLNKSLMRNILINNISTNDLSYNKNAKEIYIEGTNPKIDLGSEKYIIG